MSEQAGEEKMLPSGDGINAYICICPEDQA
jgi:hypothetical protein